MAVYRQGIERCDWRVGGFQREGFCIRIARIAGHSSITITQRYVHPQAETIDRVFSKAQRLQKENQKALQRKKAQQRVGTNLGTVQNSAKLQLTSES